MHYTPPMRSYGALVPPALLVVVAGTQLFSARTAWLTPWKGGGFGMFSTVDAPHARFVRVVLETPRGEQRVPLPDAHREDAGVLRAAPTQARADALATALARETWVAETLVPAEVEYAAVLRAAGIESGPPVTAGQAAAVAIPGRYRPLAKDESPRGETLHVDGVRVEIWRYRFDGAARQLEAERLLQSRALRRD